MSFLTDDGRPVPTVTTEQMREVDRIAVEETGPNLFQMMEHAGRSLALEVLGRSTGPAVVLAGTGGNGGGGIAAARHLRNRGRDVVVVVTDPGGLGDAPAAQLHTFVADGGRCVAPSEVEGLSPSVVVDGLVGYGLRGRPQGVVAQLVAWAAGQDAPVVALDVPSGVDATSGESPGAHVDAAVTVTLALPKPGLVADAAGELVLADLGIPAAVFERVGVRVSAGLFGDGFRMGLRRA